MNKTSKKFLIFILMFFSLFCAACSRDGLITNKITDITETEIFTVSLPELYGFNYILLEDSDYKTVKGGHFSFLIETIFSDKSRQIIVKANGILIEPTEGIYTLNTVNENTNITIEGEYANIYEIRGLNLPQGVTINESSVNFGQDYTFEVTLDLSINQSKPTVKANGETLSSTDGKYILNNITANQNITVETITKNTYTFNYISNGKGNIEGALSQTVTHGENAQTVTAIPDENNIFTGWSDGVTTASRTDSNACGNIAVYALFSSASNKISFDSENKYNIIRLDGGRTQISSLTYINYGEEFSFEIILGEKYSKSIITVFANGEVITSEEGIYSLGIINEDTVIEVQGITEDKYNIKFIKPEGISFIFNGETNKNIAYGFDFSFEVSIEEIYSESQIIFKADNVEIEETDGIYTINNITKDLTVTAEGISLNVYKITYDTDGGRETAENYVFSGGSVILPYAFKNDCLFNGWNYGGTLYKCGGILSNVQSDITLTADYTEATSGLNYSENGTQCNIWSVYEQFSETLIIPDMHDDVIIKTVYGASNYSGVTQILTGECIENWEILMYCFPSVSSVVLPKNLKTLCGGAFASCNLDMEEFLIPAAITEIPERCFQLCNIRKLKFANGSNLNKICADAFLSSKLESAVLPESLTYIGGNAFYRCQSLTQINFPSALQYIGPSSFRSCALTEVEISGAAVIEKEAFRDCVNLVSAQINGNVSGAESLFYFCTSLKDVKINALSPYMFINCSSLINVTVNGRISEIPAYSFSDCPYLQTLVLEYKNDVTIIGEYAFAGIEIAFNSSVSSNGFALDGLDNISEIGGNAFYQSALNSFKFNPQNDFTIGENAFVCYKLATFGKTEEKCILPSKLSSLGTGNFQNATFSELVFESGFNLDYLPDDTFRGSRFKMNEIAIPEGIKTIGNHVFYNANSDKYDAFSFYITKITLPSSLTSIGEYAFADMNMNSSRTSSLADKDIIIKGETPFEIGYNAFYSFQVNSNRISTFYLKNSQIADQFRTAWVTNSGYTYSDRKNYGGVEWDETENDYVPFYYTYTPIITSIDGVAEHSAKFFMNDGTQNIFKTKNFVYQYFLEKPENPVRSGYEFLGWINTLNGTDYFDFAARVNSQNDFSLYAKWQALSYNIFYFTDGGENGENESSYTVEDSFTLLDASKEGYIFDGWRLNSYDGMQITEISGRTEDIKLYARYTAITFTVSFNTNGGSFVSPKTVNYGGIFALASQLQKEGFKLDGWYTDKNLTQSYNFSSPVHSSFTLYAKWTGIKYTVKFSLNGQTLSSNTYYMGESVFEYDLEAITGYTFNGWFQDRALTNPAEFPFTVGYENKTFYADLKANGYTVILNSNNGENGNLTQSFSYDTGNYLYKNIFNKIGCTFKGWAEQTDGNAVFSDGEFINNLTSAQGATVNLYAVWEANSYLITFYSEAGSGETADKQFTYGVSGTLSLNGFTRTGYTFIGWAGVLDGAKVYDDGDEILNLTSENGRVFMLYAIWEANSYKIIYRNGEDFNKQDFVFGEAQQLNANTFEKTGYTFEGWARTDGGGITFADREEVNSLTFENGGEITLYAVWQINKYTLSFETNSVEGIEDIKIDFGDSYPLNAISKTGYTFGGWFTNADLSGEPINSITVSGDTSVYAKWNIKSFIVTFISQGDTVSNQTVDYNKNAVLPSEPEYSGEGAYSFLYWTADETYNEMFNFNSLITSDISLYAVFGAEEVIITVNNYCNGNLVSQTQVNGLTKAIFNASAVSYGNRSKLIGYYSDNNFNNPLVLPFETTVDTAVYAKYLAATTNISYRLKGDGTYMAYLTGNTDEVVIPDGIAEFNACGYEFSSVIFGRNVKSVYNISGYTGEGVFTLPKYLKDINGINTLGVSAFAFDTFLEYGGVTDTCGYSIENGVLFKGASLIKYPVLNTASAYTVPASATEISAYAFFGCTKLTEVNLNNTNAIKSLAFKNCVNLLIDLSEFSGTASFDAFESSKTANLTLNIGQQGIREIYRDGIIPSVYVIAFFDGSGELTEEKAGCSQTIKEIQINGFSSIGKQAFMSYAALKEVILSGVTLIDEKAFYGTQHLEEINLDNISTVGVSAFENSGYVNRIEFVDLTGKEYGYKSLFGAKPKTIISESVLSAINVLGSDFKNYVNDLTLESSAEGYSFRNCENLTKLTFGDVGAINTDFGGTKISELTFTYGITIGNGAFENCNELVKVTAESGITLRSGVFKNCAKLTGVIFNQAVNFDKSKGSGAPFENSGVKTLKMRFDSVTFSEMFGENSSVSEIYVLTGGLNLIKENALSGAKASVLTIQNGITSIGENAFENCKALTSLEIPVTVNSIGKKALQGTNIKEIALSGEFSYSDLLGNTVSVLETLSITDKTGVNYIAGNSYKNCYNLQTVNIPDSIKIIKAFAFYGCAKLAQTDLSNITKIYSYAFYGTKLTSLSAQNCEVLDENSLSGLNLKNLKIKGNYRLDYLFGEIPSTLETVTVAGGTTEITGGMFENAQYLKYIILQNGINAINGNAFYNCKNITNIYIPDSTEYIGQYAFYGCESLSSVIIPAKVSEIGEYAFGNCVRLESVNIKANLSEISPGLFYNCVSMENANIPYSATKINDYAFYNNTNLNGIELPSGLTNIGAFAFYNNTVLTDLYFPHGIKDIGAYAFYGCASFIETALPNNLVNLGDFAFSMCIKLETINIPDCIVNLGEKALLNCTQLNTLKMPAQYSLAEVFGSPDSVPVLLNNLIFTVGNRKISENAMSGVLTVHNVTLSEGILEIGDKAFYNCFNIKNITLPLSLGKIGMQSFYNCKLISKIVLPDGLLEIGKGAFEQCVSLAQINIPSKLYEIKEDIFYNCISLKTVSFADNLNLVSIGDYAFMKCVSLSAIIIPASVKHIGNWAFANCGALSSVTFGQNSLLKTLGDYCFKDTALVSFTLPVRCYNLGWGVFLNCINLNNFILEEGRIFSDDVTLNLSAENIGFMVFKNTKLDIESIEYTDCLSEYGEIFNSVFAREEI